MNTKQNFFAALKQVMITANEDDQEMVDRIREATTFEQLAEVAYDCAGDGEDALFDLAGFMDEIL